MTISEYGFIKLTGRRMTQHQPVFQNLQYLFAVQIQNAHSS
jgi:hypothetical protein